VPSVEHVRIQTNATSLGDADAGRARHAPPASTSSSCRCTAPTPRPATPSPPSPGSFAAITAGLDRLVAVGASVITNTVVCAANVDSLPAIIALAAALGAGASELWGYVPRVDAADARAQSWSRTRRRRSSARSRPAWPAAWR
jgi:hypothetical protein